MTNADKYLKDGEAGNFVQAFSCWYYGMTRELENADKMLANFLKAEAKPTLTEDERVILRNIDKTYTHISRTYGDIWVGIGEETADSECKRVCVFNHLFQFIKERRRIRDS